MPVQIIVNGENAAQAHQEFTDLHNLFMGGVAAPVEAPKASRKPAAPKKDAPKTEAPKVEEPKLQEDETPIPTSADLRALSLKIVDKPKVKALLDEFGFKNISSIDEDSRLEFKERLEELL